MGTTLLGGYYMLWRVDEKGTIKHAFKYFEKKYGYTPTEIAVGKDVEFTPTPGIEVVPLMCPDKHIKLR